MRFIFEVCSAYCLEVLAPQVGFEPTTHGLTVHRSNQLSYWGTHLTTGANVNGGCRACQYLKSLFACFVCKRFKKIKVKFFAEMQLCQMIYFGFDSVIHMQRDRAPINA